MYPSSFSEQNLALFITNSVDTNNTISKLEELQYLDSFPSPFIPYHEDYFVNELTWPQDPFIHHQHQQPPQPEILPINNSMDGDHHPKHGDLNAIDIDSDALVLLRQGFADHQKPDEEQQKKNNTRKRSYSKKDRHSKITTAKGPRDRRMRLSLDVARKFFDLQDILGYEKASKTVEWLLVHAHSAIEEITRDFPKMKFDSVVNTSTVSSTTSECEVVSGIDDATTTTNSHMSMSRIKMMKAKSSSSKKAKKAKLARRAALHLRARESRKEARERARKRTREKSKLLVGETTKKLCLAEAIRKKSDDLKQLGGSWFGGGGGVEGLKLVEELTLTSHQDQQRGEYGHDASSGNWTNYHHQQQQNAQIPHLNHQLSAEFDYGGKTWEAYNNMSTLGA